MATTTTSTTGSAASTNNNNNKTIIVARQAPVVSARLTLLQGLVAHPVQARAVVEEALLQEEAVLVLQRAWRRRSRGAVKARPRKRRKTRGRASKKKTHQGPPNDGEHWLWKSLRSASTRERITAVKLLQLTLEQPQQRDVHRWTRPLVRLLTRHVVVYPPPDEANVASSSRLALEWVALLKDYPLNLDDDKSSTAALTFVPHWKWLTQAVWTMATRMPVVDTTALCALVHLCFSLTMRVACSSADRESTLLSVLQTYNRHCLWTAAPHAEENDLGPLACLIGAYYSVAYHSRDFSSRKAAHEVSHMLSQLIEPSAQPQVIVQPPAPNNNSAPRARRKSSNASHNNNGLLVEGYDSDYSPEAEDVNQEEAAAEDEGNEGDEINPVEAVMMDVDEADHVDLSTKERSNSRDTAILATGLTLAALSDDDDEENGNEEGSDEDDEDNEHVEQDEDEEMDEDEEGEGGGEECMDELCVDDEDENGEDIRGVIERTLGLDGDGPVAMDLDELTAVVQASRSKPEKASPKPLPSPTLTPSLAERQRLYVRASMQVLGAHYPHVHNHSSGPIRRPYLSRSGESALFKSINKIIKPPKKPVNTKVILRRAPTQEEFFRGSLSQNPVSISSLKPAAGATCQNESYEPTVADLRHHIANDLQMAESAELIEILVANKILDVRLKLRVVHQVLWRKHLMENPNSGLASYLSSSGSVISRGTGLSIFFSSDSREGEDENERRPTITENTPASALPSLLATYRLAGVDGEATEDTVNLEDLVDPEAPAEAATAEEKEKRLEEEYGITSIVTEGRGVNVLLRAVQHAIMDAVVRIRRDDVGCVGDNPSRKRFKQSPSCHVLTLLRYCTRLPRNRKKLLQARAPTLLLTLLLEVLKALEVTESSGSQTSGGNPTAEVLQEIIESLTSDISTSTASESAEDGYESDLAQDESSMPLLLKHIETISLSPPLRRIIAKLLPFLTYGQKDLSRELAEHFDSHISLDSLIASETQEEPKDASLLMQTFVDTAMNLPATDICNSLRLELINCGFIEKLALFAVKDMPKQPPTWSPALWSEGELPSSSPKSKSNPKKKIEDGWRNYFSRKGVRSVFKILTGLCKKHPPTQTCIAEFSDFLQYCHWIEATSDNPAADVSTHGLGLLAETLLDEAIEDNETVAKLVADIRKKTKLRKQSIAQQRRKQALLKMHSLGAPGASLSPGDATRTHSTVRDAAASIFAPVLGLFNPSNTAASASSPDGSPNTKSNKKKKDSEQKKPAWLAEAESMVEETGLKCAVCQEGRTNQPKELLGLYAFVKKVSLPSNKASLRTAIDGTELLKTLPTDMPSCVVGDPVAEDWYVQGMQAKTAVNSQSNSSTESSGRRGFLFTSTTSAGNAIHISCHHRARQADRNHPKAPKSEWEGASLRNNRVNCNVILPLVSSRSSSVPLIHVNSGLSDYQSAVANIVGSAPASMLWPVLHDIRFLLLRMAYGESLNADSGGGSLASNCQLLFYQLQMAEMFDKDAQLDQRAQSHHARGLSSGCLLACSLLFTKDGKCTGMEMGRGIADAVCMAALTSVVFHNTQPCGSRHAGSSSDSEKPHPKREWLVGRELFLRGLLMCAGRRHVLGLNSSGCLSNRALSGRKRSYSFADWETAEDDDMGSDGDRASDSRGKPARRRPTRAGRSSTGPTVEDFQNAFRPMITLFAIFDQLSAEFTLNMDDVQIEESSQRLAQVIENCQRSRSIHELIRKAKVPLDHSQMMELLQKGMILA